MAETGLYEVLGITSSATADEIRKAYKKRALQTHPDRIPGATGEQKSTAEEEFRKVNNAYEVLNDPQNRRVYDLHGQWPPPEPEQQESVLHRQGSTHRQPFDRRRHHHHRHHHRSPYSDDLHDFRHPFGSGFLPRHQSHFQFTDPFVLFDAIFADMSRADPFFAHFHQRDPFFSSPARVFRNESLFPVSLPPPGWGVFPEPVMNPRNLGIRSFSSQSHTIGPHDQWTRESRVIRTINGITESVWKRTDSTGNEHITRTYPDGREVYTINGIEQNPIQRGPDRAVAPPPPYRAIDDGPRSTHEYNPPYSSRSGSRATYNKPALQEDDDRHKARWWRR